MAIGSAGLAYIPIPPGGTAGQVLAKIDSIDYNATWSNPGGGGGNTGSLSAGTTRATLGEVVFSNSNGVSFGVNGQTITASVSPSGAGIGAVAAGTQTATSGTIAFVNSNGLTFGMSGSSQITGSYTVPAVPPQTVQPGIQSVSAGTTRVTTGEVVFSNSNGISFGADGQTITASHTVPVVSNAIQQVSSANAAGTNTSRFAADDHVHAGVYAVGVSTGGNTAGDTRVGVGRLVLAAVGAATLSQATAVGELNTVSISVPAQTVQPGIQSISAGTTRVTTGEIVFANSNGLSFGIDGQTLTGSYTVPTQSNQTLGLYASSNTTGQSSSSTFDARSITFRGAGVASVGFSAGEVLVSVPSGGGGLTNINVSAGTTSQNLSNVVLSDSNNVRFGLNGSTITAELIPRSMFQPYRDANYVNGQQGQGTLHISPVDIQWPLCFDRAVLQILNSNASNSSGSHTLSFWVGLYTRTGSTLSLLVSGSRSEAITQSGTVGSYSRFSNQRFMTVPMTATVFPNDYWIGYISRTTSAGANGSYSQWLASRPTTVFGGPFGEQSAFTHQQVLGLGAYSATTSAMPGSLAFSQISGNQNTLVFRPPILHFISGSA